MSSAKKKVSFDIDPGILSDVQSLCRSRGIRPADFYRDAVKEKMEKDAGKWITIYIPKAGKIVKTTIDINWYRLQVFDASEMMRNDFGAVHEGILREKSEDEIEELVENRKYNFDQISQREHETVISEILADRGEVSFFTKNRYF